jgi:EAL and modified HD-GYP domain-containing signal transduction protein
MPTAQHRDSPARDCFVARQPIFDTRRQVQGYELLFRSGPANHFPADADADATRRVIGDTLSVFGLDVLTAGKRAFINFSRDVLLDDSAYLLPPDRTVVELLETIEPDEPVLASCRRLKRDGYRLALDDYVGDPAGEAFIELADIIKVDFRGSTAEQHRLFAERFRPLGIQLLAEKVETWEEWRAAAALGYSCFQGYFFCRPETLSRTALSPSRTNYLRLLEELNRADVDYDRVERIIKLEPPLALKLLSYINSAQFGCEGKVKSIRQAAVLLGQRNLRRWANVTAVLGLCEGKPPELFVTCVVRARFCELLGHRFGLDEQTLDLFLAGLLSLMDAILDRPLAQALAEFAVPDALRDSLLSDSSAAGLLCGLARAYENGDWPQVAEAARALNVPPARVAEAYRSAVAWSADTQGALCGSPE